LIPPEEPQWDISRRCEIPDSLEIIPSKEKPLLLAGFGVQITEE